jgi:hypothetical protein
MGCIAQLHADREIEARRTAAEASNLHSLWPSRSRASQASHRCEYISSLNI